MRRTAHAARPRTDTAPTHEDIPQDNGGEAFLHALYQRHGNPLKRFAARLLAGDHHRAEDVLQEAFVRAWRHSAAFGGDIDKARPWLFTVVRNLVIDHHRACRTRPSERHWSDVQETAAVDEADRILTAHMVARALAALPVQQREVITLMYFTGYTVTQTADRLGIPPGTVKSRSFYAMRTLRKELAGCGVADSRP
jgi:RNA polymerase sigma-70 factor (ECF subfamily)